MTNRDSRAYRVGPFSAWVNSNISSLRLTLDDVYRDYEKLTSAEEADFRITLDASRNWFGKRQLLFKAGYQSPFSPAKPDHALAVLEWGINWCVSQYMHVLLMLHSAAVERNGHGMLLPAHPGSGKSTLGFALDRLGYRMLCDEFGLVDPESGCLVPYPRLVPLKNDSIDVVSDMFPEAIRGPELTGTRKGRVVHFKPSRNAIHSDQVTVSPRWIVFPAFERGCVTKLTSMTKEQAFVKLTANSFNYHVMGQAGFHCVSRLVSECECYYLRFSSIEAAKRVLDGLTDHPSTPAI